MIKKKKKLDELRKNNIIELQKNIFKLQILIRKIKFKSQQKEKNIKTIKETKKEIARTFTILNKKTSKLIN